MGFAVLKATNHKYSTLEGRWLRMVLCRFLRHIAFLKYQKQRPHNVLHPLWVDNLDLTALETTSTTKIKSSHTYTVDVHPGSRHRKAVGKHFTTRGINVTRHFSVSSSCSVTIYYDARRSSTYTLT